MNAPHAAVELMAPAGDWECLRAAIENGADAVYFGLDVGLNARHRAANFRRDELPAVLALLHGRGVRGYLTLNTLVFSDELPAAEAILREASAAGVDAVIVQDLGLVQLARAACPDLPLHASTQMTLTSAECIRLAEHWGIERVVAPRELSIDELRQVAAQTSLPLEAFVHGALCVAYSGQCLTSESFGGRSANRGQCAQACRLPYELVCDGRDTPLGDQRYLLSPQDLAAYDLTPELIAAGVRCFKIEGRLKTPEYVANITRHYRRAIDAALAGQAVEFTRRDVEEMELSFSRGFSHGWLHGCDHKMLVPALSSSKRGVLLGHVVRIAAGRVAVQLQSSVKRGDGLVFEGDRAAGDEQGGRVYEVLLDGRSLAEPVERGVVELSFARGAIDPSRLHVGQQVWKTDDPELTARLRRSFASAQPQRRWPLAVEVVARTGQPLVAIALLPDGRTARVASDEPLPRAEKHPLTDELLARQLGRLGGTEFELARLSAEIAGEPMAPLSVLGRVRHRLVDELRRLLAEPPPRRVAADPALPRLRAACAAEASPADALAPAHAPDTTAPVLHVLVRSLAQLQAALDAGARRLYADFQDIREYREATRQAHAAGAEIWLATPRIQKPSEAPLFRALGKHGADGLLTRNLAGLQWGVEQRLPVVADFSLNAANELTVGLLRRLGAERVTASYDLNREQLGELVDHTTPAWLEVVVHQHMPMFHMEHCVFCAVLSPGTNKTNCGRPCDTHDVRLRDRVGVEHPLRADVGCRNTLFNATPQSAAEALPELLERGVRHFRIELLEDRSDPPAATIIGLYADLLAGRIAAGEVWRRLRAANRVGVTRGTLEERRDPLAIL